jgi:hypothetical protein
MKHNLIHTENTTIADVTIADIETQLRETLYISVKTSHMITVELEKINAKLMYYHLMSEEDRYFYDEEISELTKKRNYLVDTLSYNRTQKTLKDLKDLTHIKNSAKEITPAGHEQLTIIFDEDCTT